MENFGSHLSASSREREAKCASVYVVVVIEGRQKKDLRCAQLGSRYYQYYNTLTPAMETSEIWSGTSHHDVAASHVFIVHPQLLWRFL